MFEVLLFSLITGLFIAEVVVLRMLMKRQVNETLKTLVKDWDSERKSVNILPVPKPSPVFQNVTKTMRS